ncbi:MAG: aldo/keto reductase, partial [Terriglobia bacterium]
MKRREFLSATTLGLGAAWLGGGSLLAATEAQFSAADTVTLGKTGIRTSRLACGTGTIGGGGHSRQTRLGVDGLADLLVHGYDHGLRFFDSADSYGSHPAVAAALKRLPREKVTVLTKSDNRDP